LIVTDPALEAKILRLHHTEGWGAHTIARQIGVHHSVVNRVLAQAGLPRAVRAPRPTMLDPFVPFVLETLEQYPTLSAERLFHMVAARGYPGSSSSTFRARIAELRPRPLPEAYLRVSTLPGEQAQVDWAHFGHVEIGRARRPLMAFVMVLSHSRAIFLRFYLNAGTANFVRGHVDAFAHWGSVPRVCLYDNLKSAVLERTADAIRFNPVLLDLASHYRFEPRPVAPRRGNEKGRVERAIRYVRSSFFAARTWTDVADLNAQALAWCIGPAAERRCPGQPERTVGAVFEDERAVLLDLPDTPFESEEVVEVRVGKQPYLRFDLNDYSVPHSAVRRGVTVRARLDTVRVLADGELVAEHARLWDKGETAEDEAHVKALVAAKGAAREHRGQDRLRRAVPSSGAFLERAAARGEPLKGLVRELGELLDLYRAGELEAAVAEALERDVVHAHAVRQALERRRAARRDPPPTPLRLTNPKLAEVTVRAAPLVAYDTIGDDDDDDDDDNDNDDQSSTELSS